MCVVHAVCMLSPPVAVDLLKRLQTVPGFDVEQHEIGSPLTSTMISLTSPPQK